MLLYFSWHYNYIDIYIFQVLLCAEVWILSDNVNLWQFNCVIFLLWYCDHFRIFFFYVQKVKNLFRMTVELINYCFKILLYLSENKFLFLNIIIYYLLCFSSVVLYFSFFFFSDPCIDKFYLYRVCTLFFLYFSWEINKLITRIANRIR